MDHFYCNVIAWQIVLFTLLCSSDKRAYGILSVRTDLAAPRIKRISDRTNYGEEGSVYELLFPTLYSLSGVHERDFFCPRTKNEVGQHLP